MRQPGLAVADTVLGAVADAKTGRRSAMAPLAAACPREMLVGRYPKMSTLLAALAVDTVVVRALSRRPRQAVVALRILVPRRNMGTPHKL